MIPLVFNWIWVAHHILGMHVPLDNIGDQLKKKLHIYFPSLTFSWRGLTMLANEPVLCFAALVIPVESAYGLQLYTVSKTAQKKKKKQILWVKYRADLHGRTEAQMFSFNQIRPVFFVCLFFVLNQKQMTNF